MGRFFLAWKLFFKTLFNGAFARRAATLFDSNQSVESADASAQPAVAKSPAEKLSAVKTSPAPATPPVSTRSDALTLLAVLQREARLIDFLKENIQPFDDAQIGAAVRDVHRDASAVLERLLAIRPVLEQTEGADVPLTSNNDPARIRLTGNLAAQTPPRGRLAHAGWQATQLDLPQFTGGRDSAKIIVPAEVEI